MRKMAAILVASSLLISVISAFAEDNWLSLAGQWQFAIDYNNAGINEKWFQKSLDDQINLPGTTDENHKGRLNNNARETLHLTRLYPFAGSAWYQHDINIPVGWSNKHITLFLERTKNSQLWLDANEIGSQNSLTTPHVYSLDSLSPGLHRLTLRINNSQYAPIGDAHQISDHTQTNWNGIIGKIGLLIKDPVYIDDVQIYPNYPARNLRLQIEISNATDQNLSGSLAINVTDENGTPQSETVSIPFSIANRHTIVSAIYPLKNTVQCWDEFSPTLYKLNVSINASANNFKDKREITFGLRDFAAAGGTQFRINGRTTFLRGKHDACVFPLTGYPPMSVEQWLKVLSIAKSYGINHYRFHTWCPPEAAFEAADRLGIYMEPELPNWSAFGDKKHDEFCKAEGERILKTFGNHPSFVMFSLGNELGGQQELMAPFVKHFRDIDPRHLYAQGSNNWFGMVDPNDDFWVSWQIQWQKRIRGSYGACDVPLGHVQIGPANTLKDYSGEISGIHVPVISMETGQYQISPDYKEIDKYTGVVRARNFEIFRDRLKKNGMLDQADDFFRASGALSVLCYKEDIEAALRTRGFGGFQLLDLQDFPGQGTALVGILNAFMESKGLIEPAQWRQFCSQTVPLALISKYTWTNSETFTANAEVAHYGATDLNSAVGIWTLKNSKMKILTSGRFPSINIRQGTLTGLGQISFPLKDYPAPAKLTFELSLEDTNFINSWNIWVYPENVDTAAGKVFICRKFDEAKMALDSGKNVLLIPEPNDLNKSIEGAFASDFWNYGMFKKLAQERKMKPPAGTLGIFCDPNHPALAGFPTDFHSNWQWFYLLRNSRSMILDSMPADYRPIVQVIDNCERAHKLAAIFEVKAGAGKLLVCSINLPALQNKPEARQLLHSLLQYMNSDKFNPTAAIDYAVLEKIVQ